MTRLFSRFWLQLTAGLIILNAMVIMAVTISSTLSDYKIATAKSAILGAQIPVFNKNVLMSDAAFRSIKSFPSVESVQNYLNSQNAPIKNYTEKGKSAAQVIFQAARGETSAKWGLVPTLNPGLLIAYLDKEQSLISLSGYNITTDPEHRMKYAMGYGCPDNAGCDDEYAGFYNQVNWAAYQLEYNYAVVSKASGIDPYKVNTTIKTLDPDSVYLTNAATASNYRYTPHIYWGNYNLWKIMTANGWLDSSETFSTTDLDTANLQYKVLPGADNTPASIVNIDEIRPLLVTPPVLGTENASIARLQTFLRQEGAFTYAFITGFYGPITQTALTTYLKSDKYLKPVTSLPIDGCMGLKNQIWSIGQTGNDVLRLQECMQTAGTFSFPGGPTGYYGEVSQKAFANWNNVTTTVKPSTTQTSLPKVVIPIIIKPTPTPVVVIPTPILEACASQKSDAKSWSVGRTGDDVRDLQQCLKDAGIYTWSSGVTGYYGNYTSSLIRNSNSACVSQKTTAKSWSVGRTGDDVRGLQQCLKDAGIYTWQYGVTGYYGNYTSSLVN